MTVRVRPARPGHQGREPVAEAGTGHVEVSPRFGTARVTGGTKPTAGNQAVEDTVPLAHHTDDLLGCSAPPPSPAGP
ncbi:hypothetical protein FHS32_002246 [Streptomyces albaduncus]|uniref:Uncharacterized protein n=1 Tax=Streptomyces griseoloalbus TaxID=67303 RepID=A0A7W8BL97_9ACTN|nr:hypothetical protein [Streptomyces albaduncus]MBB5125514.1 hypothetical protein [Streptomyces albaduncus]GGW27202.1 hypothetical protein GCM10010340_00640 [Streptomyces albaduncus]